MGTHKQAAITKAVTSAGKRYQRIEKLAKTAAATYSNLYHVAQNDEAPLIEYKLKRRDDGSWLVIMKREKGIDIEVMFAGGEDVWEAIDRSNGKLAASEWRVQDRQ